MSLDGLGLKSGSRNLCLIIAWTGQQGPVLYKGDKGVNVAARPLEGSPAKALSLQLISIPHPTRIPVGPAKAM